MRRFFKVQLQTIWAPAVTTLLFLVIFTVATGGRRPVLVGGETVAFADFIAPGLIVMGMLNNAFANASFSLLVGKIQGTIVDYLMPPLSTAELLAEYRQLATQDGTVARNDGDVAQAFVAAVLEVCAELDLPSSQTVDEGPRGPRVAAP